MLALSAHTDSHISLDSLSQGINTPSPHPKKTWPVVQRDLNCLSPPGVSIPCQDGNCPLPALVRQKFLHHSPQNRNFHVMGLQDLFDILIYKYMRFSPVKAQASSQWSLPELTFWTKEHVVLHVNKQTLVLFLRTELPYLLNNGLQRTTRQLKATLNATLWKAWDTVEFN